MRMSIVAMMVAALCIGCTSNRWLFSQRRFADEGATYLVHFINAVNEGTEAEAAASWNPERRNQAVSTARFMRWTLDQYAAENPKYVLVNWKSTWNYNLKADVALYPTPLASSPLWCERWKVDLAFPQYRIDAIERTSTPVSCP